jgi:hypothetical protein
LRALRFGEGNDSLHVDFLKYEWWSMTYEVRSADTIKILGKIGICARWKDLRANLTLMKPTGPDLGKSGK